MEHLKILRGLVARGNGNAALQASAEGHRLVAELGPHAFAALGPTGLLEIVFPLQNTTDATGRATSGASLVAARDVLFELGMRRWNQPAAVLAATESPPSSPFLVMAADIVEKLSVGDSAPAWDRIIFLFDEWADLFRRRRRLTAAEECGLWGELWFIANTSSPSLALAGWLGPDDEPTDFLVDGVALDVKTSKYRLKHHVSQRQADRPVGDHRAYLLSMWVASDPVRGTLLSQLVEQLRPVVDDCLLTRKLLKVGYSQDDATLYEQRWMLLEAPRIFSMSSVPRVRQADPGISDIRFTVQLDEALAVDGDELTALGKTLCYELDRGVP